MSIEDILLTQIICVHFFFAIFIFKTLTLYGDVMLKALKIILEVQEVDMQMIQLMRLKAERQRDLANINEVKTGLRDQAETKEEEITDLKKLIRLMEGELTD